MTEYKVSLPSAEELTAQVVDQIVSGYMNGGEYREGARDAIQEAILEAVAPNIGAEVGAMVMDVLEKPIQPTNQFGEPTGEPVTMRARVAAQVKAFLEEKVDRDGKPRPNDGNYYGNTERKTRAEWAIHKAVESIVNDELRKAIDAASKEVKAQVGAAVQKSVAETVKRVLSLP